MEEVNFWKPSSQPGFKVLQWGEPFLFKLGWRPACNESYGRVVSDILRLMTTPEILTLLALVVGPISAIQLQLVTDYFRQKKQRRVFTFKTLMMTRGTGLSPDHVQALNMIDVEFYGKRKVIAAWKVYLDHLVNNQPGDNDWPRWNDRRDELLTDLLSEMGLSLGYKFSKVDIRRAIYNPKGHYEIENELNVIRKGLVEVLTGKTPLPMDVRHFPDMEPTPEQQAANDLLMQLVKKEKHKLLPEEKPSDIECKSKND